MSPKSGLILLWQVVSLSWISIAVWLCWDDLAGGICPLLLSASDEDLLTCPNRSLADQRIFLESDRYPALAIIMVPPVVALALSLVIAWIVKKFS